MSELPSAPTEVPPPERKIAVAELATTASRAVTFADADRVSEPGPISSFAKSGVNPVTLRTVATPPG